MSIIGAITQSQRNQSIAQAFGAADITTAAMQTAIKDWFRLYYSGEVTDNEDPCQQIPFTIVQRMTKTAFAEYSWATDNPYAETVMRSLEVVREAAVNLAMIGGTCLLKPIPKRDGWSWVKIPRNNYIVFGRDETGHLTDIGTSETTVHGAYTYTLLERRSVDPGGYLTIQNMLYRTKTMSGDGIGVRVPMSMLERYATLPDKYTYAVPFGLGVLEISMPMENAVDGSPDAMSVYAKAAGVIHNINRAQKQLDVEFENARSRLGISSDLAQPEKAGCKQFDDDVFLLIDGDPESVGFNIFAPTIRDESFERLKQSYYRDIESKIGLQRGFLSEVDATPRTATEIRATDAAYAVTIGGIQDMWESSAVKPAMALCDTLGKLYHVQGAQEIHKDTVVVDWGNGVLYDEDKTWAGYLDMVARGILRPEYAIGWRFNMPTDTPEDLQAIREKYMPEIQQLGGMFDE